MRNVLPSIRVPTFVIHRSGDLCLKVEEGRYAASLIPGSKFVELDGDDHLPFVGDQEPIVAQIRGFVSDSHPDIAVDRLLATVMCVRVEPVNGDDKTSERQQSEALDRAIAFIQRMIVLFNGRRTSDGDGNIVAAFDGPARSIRCAAEIRNSAPGLGIAVGVGLHTGECDAKDWADSGSAVDLASHIAEHARPRELIASRTVKDLMAGSGIEFSESGARSFSGVEGEWTLLTVDTRQCEKYEIQSVCKAAFDPDIGAVYGIGPNDRGPCSRDRHLRSKGDGRLGAAGNGDSYRKG
ncbi:MAG TPA: hypothetical protein PLX39_10785 [Pyrinomonadaceae bacterium]|nr:hypothetical protein [Pyrinomonadaceae bacterium]